MHRLGAGRRGAAKDVTSTAVVLRELGKPAVCCGGGWAVVGAGGFLPLRMERAHRSDQRVPATQLPSCPVPPGTQNPLTLNPALLRPAAAGGGVLTRWARPLVSAAAATLPGLERGPRLVCRGRCAPGQRVGAHTGSAATLPARRRPAWQSPRNGCTAVPGGRGPGIREIQTSKEILGSPSGGTRAAWAGTGADSPGSCCAVLAVSLVEAGRPSPAPRGL